MNSNKSVENGIIQPINTNTKQRKMVLGTAQGWLFNRGEIYSKRVTKILIQTRLYSVSPTNC